MGPCVVDSVDEWCRQRHVEDGDPRLPPIEALNRVPHQVATGVEVGRPTHEPVDPCRIAQRRTDTRLAAVPVQVRRGNEPVVFDRDPRLALDHPRIDDVLTRVAFHLTQQCGDGYGAAGDHRLHMCIDKIRELLAVVTEERADFGHDTASRKRWFESEAATGAARPRS